MFHELISRHNIVNAITAVFCIIFSCHASRVNQNAKSTFRVQGITVHDKRSIFGPLKHFLIWADVDTAVNQSTQYWGNAVAFHKCMCSK